MKQVSSLIFLVGVLMLAACRGSAEINNTPGADGCPNGFDKSAVIFDTLTICATRDVSRDKLDHAANVAAEWLDNDEDGTVDEPRLLDAMAENNPVVVMTSGVLNDFQKIRLLNRFGDRRIQDLGASETNPGGDERDASQEEIHHIIMNAGWQSLFPAVFSEQSADNSKLYQVWKVADENRYYVYNDPTCDDSCKVTEFVYLATAAYFGDVRDLDTDEIRLYSYDELADKLPALIEIFESADYTYPTNHWPDGTYPFSENIQFNADS